MEYCDLFDINSGNNRNMSPYVIKDNNLYIPYRYYEMYFVDYFEDNNIMFTFKNNHVIIDKSIDIDTLYKVQYSNFNFDVWYDDLKHLTFDSYIIDFNIDKVKTIESINKIINRHKFWFVKLSCMSPKDESRSGKQHKFNNAKDIVDRLFESERTRKEIECGNTKLIMRQWVDLPEEYEFRCFVYKGKLRAISQYNCYQYVEEFQNIKMQNKIKERVISFYNSITLPYEDCCMDIVIWDKDIFIIEINEFGIDTRAGSSCFNWIQDYDILYNSKEPIIKFCDDERYKYSF